MEARLFWKSLAVQAFVLAIPFVVLAATLDESFFEDRGWLAGPAVWLACSAVTARILSLPLGYVLFSAVAGGVAGAIVFLLASHWAGMAAGLLVFAASCGSYDPDAEADARREYEEHKQARREGKRAERGGAAAK
ncbi:MAG: hypothetical protein ACRDM7_19400 [Thermoleophilaceae bacterium]